MSQLEPGTRTDNSGTVLTTTRASSKRSRLWLVGFWFVSLLASWLILRSLLFIQFGSTGSVGDIVLVFLRGFYGDLLAASWLTLPLVGWLALARAGRFRNRALRRLFWCACLIFWAVQVFILFVEYYFFEEFRSRFNTVAVDYLQYPREVFVNIWDSYHVGAVLGVCVCL